MIVMMESVAMWPHRVPNTQEPTMAKAKTLAAIDTTFPMVLIRSGEVRVGVGELNGGIIGLCWHLHIVSTFHSRNKLYFLGFTNVWPARSKASSSEGRRVMKRGKDGAMGNWLEMEVVVGGAL